jgi:hypothetical protein
MISPGPMAQPVATKMAHAPESGCGVHALERHYDGGTAASKRHYGRRRGPGPHPKGAALASPAAAAAATLTARAPPEPVAVPALLLSAGKAP